MTQTNPTSEVAALVPTWEKNIYLLPSPPAPSVSLPKLFSSTKKKEFLSVLDHASEISREWTENERSQWGSQWPRDGVSGSRRAHCEAVLGYALSQTGHPVSSCTPVNVAMKIAGSN